MVNLEGTTGYFLICCFPAGEPPGYTGAWRYSSLHTGPCISCWIAWCFHQPFSSLSRPLWKMAQLSGKPATPACFGPSVNLLRLLSVPLSSSSVTILNGLVNLEMQHSGPAFSWTKASVKLRKATSTALLIHQCSLPIVKCDFPFLSASWLFPVSFLSFMCLEILSRSIFSYKRGVSKADFICVTLFCIFCIWSHKVRK